MPASLNQLMVPFFTQGHHALLTDSPYVFVDMMGRPLTHITFGTYFHKMTRTLQPDFPQLAPSLLRHVFVDERMSKRRVEGPDDRGAAHVMGNSERQWHDSYDLKFDTREAQAAVDAMDTWRQQVLGGAGPSKQLACAESDDVGISSSDDDWEGKQCLPCWNAGRQLLCKCESCLYNALYTWQLLNCQACSYQHTHGALQSF